jgi:hypothetical protein
MECANPKSHGAAFIENFDLPIGALSESALEARIKYNRRAREHHARKTSMKDNVHDAFNYLMCTSDSYMYLTRNKQKLLCPKRAELKFTLVTSFHMQLNIKLFGTFTRFLLSIHLTFKQSWAPDTFTPFDIRYSDT